MHNRIIGFTIVSWFGNMVIHLQAITNDKDAAKARSTCDNANLLIVFRLPVLIDPLARVFCRIICVYQFNRIVSGLDDHHYAMNEIKSSIKNAHPHPTPDCSENHGEAMCPATAPEL